MFAVGRPKWAASQEPTASATPTNTMGIVPVACLAAAAAGVPGATITLGLSATSCVASSGQALCSSVLEPIPDGDVLSLDVPDVGQPLLEGLELRRWARRAVEEEPDSGRLRRRDTRR
jgi:hypothetical protein